MCFQLSLVRFSSSGIPTLDSPISVGGKLAWATLFFLVKVELSWIQDLVSSPRPLWRLMIDTHIK